MRIVIVGAGHAGVQLAAALAPTGHGIVLVGDETALPYHRPPLSKGYMLGEIDETGLALRPAAFYDTIERHAGIRAVAIDRSGQRLMLADGAALAYDHLVLATGLRNRRLAGALSLRDIDDAAAIRSQLATARTAVVIGAGFIGLEFAAVARTPERQVTVIEQAPQILGRSVSAPVADAIAGWHRARGTVLRCATTATEADFHADLVLAGIGAEPDIALAAAAGLKLDNGIAVDALLATSDPAISAIGDCASFPTAAGRTRLESVQNATDQARCLAARLAGRPAPYDAVPWFWSDQGDIKLQIAGLGAGADQLVLRGDPASLRFSVFRFRAGRLAAVESINRPADHMAARKLLGRPGRLTPEQAADERVDLKALASQA
jgi:3-phenylpropionate/trans-cinnamate dioxygenase ferredoxin reductase subunit